MDAGTFDRVVVTCVLHHLADPEVALEEMLRVARPRGVIDILIPSDPGFMFRLARRIGPVRRAERVGLADVKRMVDARDHRNHVGALSVLIHHVFRNSRVVARSYPIAGVGWNFSLWTAFRIRT
jgi:ubiquinone/menaquinone biosynthesis C-methylase UbiE